MHERSIQEAMQRFQEQMMEVGHELGGARDLHGDQHPAWAEVNTVSHGEMGGELTLLRALDANCDTRLVKNQGGACNRISGIGLEAQHEGDQT
jgi:hypothetical protein